MLLKNKSYLALSTIICWLIKVTNSHEPVGKKYLHLLNLVMNHKVSYIFVYCVFVCQMAYKHVNLYVI